MQLHMRAQLHGKVRLQRLPAEQTCGVRTARGAALSAWRQHSARVAIHGARSSAAMCSVSALDVVHPVTMLLVPKAGCEADQQAPTGLGRQAAAETNAGFAQQVSHHCQYCSSMAALNAMQPDAAQ